MTREPKGPAIDAQHVTLKVFVISLTIGTKLAIELTAWSHLFMIQDSPQSCPVGDITDYVIMYALS